MLKAEKKFIDAMLKAGKNLPKELLFQSVSILIRSMRKRLRMTQHQLAKRVKLPQSYIAKLETGKSIPSMETLEKVFKGLGCAITLLLVPEIDPNELLKKQALIAAEKKIKYVAGTMALEEQLPSKKALEEMVAEEQKKLLDSGTSKIWE